MNEFALELILELLDLLAKGLQLSLLMVDAGVIVDLLHMVLLNSYSLKARVTSASILAHTMEQREDKVQRAKSRRTSLADTIVEVIVQQSYVGRVQTNLTKCTILRNYNGIEHAVRSCVWHWNTSNRKLQKLWSFKGWHL